MRSLGPEYVCHSVWEELPFEEVLLSCGVSESVISIMEALVVGRLSSLESERHTYKWVQDHSAIWELPEKPLNTHLV